MAAGIATLRELKTVPKSIGSFEQRSAALVDGVLTRKKERRGAHRQRVGSMFTWFFQPDTVHDWDTAAKSDTQAFGKFHRAMLELDIYLPPSQYEAMFMSAAHSEADIQQTIAAAAEAL